MLVLHRGPLRQLGNDPRQDTQRKQKKPVRCLTIALRLFLFVPGRQCLTSPLFLTPFLIRRFHHVVCLPSHPLAKLNLYDVTSADGQATSHGKCHKFYSGVSIHGGTPKWMVYNGKSHLQMDDLGTPFQEYHYNSIRSKEKYRSDDKYLSEIEIDESDEQFFSFFEPSGRSKKALASRCAMGLAACCRQATPQLSWEHWKADPV